MSDNENHSDNRLFDPKAPKAPGYHCPTCGAVTSHHANKLACSCWMSATSLIVVNGVIYAPPLVVSSIEPNLANDGSKFGSPKFGS